MKQKPKIWIISELFYPDQTSTAFILKEISDFLQTSRDVEVICGPANYQQEIYTKKKNNTNNVKITRVKSLNLNKNNLFLRSIRLIILSLTLTVKYVRKSNKLDKVLIVTNPAPLLLIFALISNLLNRKIILLVHDVFPENTIPSQIISNPKSLIYKLLKKVFDFAYSQFETIIVLGRDMKSVIHNKIISKRNDNKIKIIENWADANEIFPFELYDFSFEKWGVSNKFIFLFAGNIGRSQALEELFSIIRKVSNSFVHFVFLGDGALKKKLTQYKENSKLDNITIGDSFLRSDQNRLLNSCHAGIVSLAKGMEGLGVPSKSYNILAAGKPILYFGDDNSEISLLINENSVGWSFNSPDTLLEFFNQIDNRYIDISKKMGIKCRRLAEDKYSKSTILNKYLDVI
jgi:glycosyltransferase involved in cell wall biosynthesis